MCSLGYSMASAHTPVQGDSSARSCRRSIFLVGPTSYDLQPSPANSRCSALASSQGARIDVALLISRQDDRQRLRVDWRNDGIRCRRQQTVDEIRAGNGPRLGAPVALEFGPMPANANNGRSSLSVNHTRSFFLVSGSARVRIPRSCSPGSRSGFPASTSPATR
jgi:hypothetical protein